MADRIGVAFPRPVLVGRRAARIADRGRAAEALRRRDHRRGVCGIVGGTDACPGRQVRCRARRSGAGRGRVEPIGRHDRSWPPPVVHQAHRAIRRAKGQGSDSRGHGVARICESTDRRREDRRRAAGQRADARRMDGGGLRDDDARCASAAARSRHGGRRVEQGRCPPRDRSGLLSGRPAVSRARRRASGAVPPGASAAGAEPPERWSRATRR